MAFPPDALASALGLRVVFGATGNLRSSTDVRIEVSCLGGNPHEVIWKNVTPAATEAGLWLFRSNDVLLGHASVPFDGGDLAAHAQRVYQRVLSACRGRSLYRIWNYVPRINAVTGGMENYRAFCKGRSLAFETAFGGAFQRRLPAASAVGSDGTTLEVIFVAGESNPRHVENPEQIPAYHYPVDYGPRSPSFSRATIVAQASAGEAIYISGTAAIKGHATVAPGSLGEQIDCTLDNLRLVSRSCDVGDDLGRNLGWKRHVKVYLRHAEDYSTAAKALQGRLLRDGDSVCFLRADICRAALNIEIEVTLTR